ncbi:uncharacterized protein LOC107995334 isoform X1 [Apis cerana]|uniref:Uncharacterized protein LOC102656645 isoform X1 n=1 Tax=Apis mellifera TaxID=7460 RepID=A0A7M7SPA1_APIME|nr:uncharacterized protein LOC107995334 isoform X1 [Apis cerana]XP_026297959.1 uncharacterized protein LOC102656645 isoform X1 [Apis mellifera]KAG6802971.1 hypothetical protein HZU73_01807 [Apis mellifera caucasica]KAG9431872.1 hypothetical protein HZU67_06517 [Apis mellifera carnica]|eukprot:XP_026297959.1 uncharacterized protein LOC102656645 isoform X1 [Apis mellifera]
MENEHLSSTEISTDCSSNSDSIQNVDNQCKEILDEEQGKKDLAEADLTLDLGSVLPNYDRVSENDDSLEKLSAVLEQPEDLVILEGTQLAEDDQDDKDLNCILRERIESLSEVMQNLKQELKKEIELWKKEREELQLLREKDDELALEEATAAARAAAAAYAAESPLSNNLGDLLDITSEDTFRELTILEYEKRLAKYQDEYSFSQAEKRYNARWKMVANAYKQKLMEVERLCNEELEKVKKNVNHLQPLKEMISQWYTDEENHGDSIKRTDFVANTQKINTFNENNTRNSHIFQKIDAEVNMAPEIFVARFKSDDFTKMDKFYG